MKYKCTKCKDTGFIQYYPIDDLPIYKWQKPKTRKCVCLKNKKALI